MNTIRVDFNKNLGVIKPLHGINNSPITYGEELPELREAGIPFVRLHDACGLFGGTRFVDVPNVFPNFNADPNDPASYDFAFTDAYMKGLVASGVKIFYRLGVTIENNYSIKPYRIHPPADYLKWAQICAGIVRHYNKGWCDGFHYGIEYWEIWNEPENPPMWTGTPEQYFELYRVAANELKRQFPEIKVGGYGGCGFYAQTRPNANAFHKSFITFFQRFLTYISAPETVAPLDFYSWHLYTTDPHEIVAHADFADRTLRQFGFAETESIFDEWNVVDSSNPDCWDAMKEMPGATFVAAAFCLMQRAPIDKAMYYDALPQRCYGGLYYFPSQKVTKTYHAFRAFNVLYQLGSAVAFSSVADDNIHVCAAADIEGNGAVFIVNRHKEDRAVELKTMGLEKQVRCRVLDQTRKLEDANIGDGYALLLPPQSVVLIEFA